VRVGLTPTPNHRLLPSPGPGSDTNDGAMNETNARRLAGWTALLSAVALLIELPLYFVYEGAPPDANVLARLLIGLFALGLLLLFVTTIRELFGRAGPEHRWLGSAATTTGLCYVVVTLIANGLEAGAVIAADESIDPTIAVSGTYLLYGSIGRLLLAMFLAAMAGLVLRTRLLPRWVGVSAGVLAVINLAFVPSLFFGNTPANFYAANGWGTTASMGGLLCLWLLATGIAALRSAGRAGRTDAGGRLSGADRSARHS